VYETRSSSDRPSGPNSILGALGRPIEPWRDPAWQRLWLAIEPRPWRSLGLIPAADGGGLQLTLGVAVTLARTGMVHLQSPIHVADGTQVPLSQLAGFLQDVQHCTTDSDRILVALAPVKSSPVTVQIAQSVDAVLLCVLYDRMSSGQAKQTIKEIGSPRFLGSAIFHPHQVPHAK
jgi:hypothetical protein